MPSDIDVQHDGHVDIITISRPEVRNALRLQSYDELERAVRESQARAIVITGADPAFCSGDDVREIMGGGEQPDKPAITTPRLTPAADAILHTNIPVIAAVNGAAVGWGMELSLMADIRIASEQAKFGELFVLRGLCTDVSGIGRLASIVGRDNAARLLFTGDVIAADEAMRIGLVSRGRRPRASCSRRQRRWPSRSPSARRWPSPRSRRGCARRSTRTGPSSACGCRHRSPRCSRPRTTVRACKSFLEKRQPQFVGR